jgi:hypothetical protein
MHIRAFCQRQVRYNILDAQTRALGQGDTDSTITPRVSVKLDTHSHARGYGQVEILQTIALGSSVKTRRKKHTE